MKNFCRNFEGRVDCFYLLILLVIVFSFSSLNAATYYSRATGDWNSTSTWSTSSHSGSAASAVPTSTDVVLIGAHTITVTANVATSGSRLGALSFDVSGGSISVNSSITLWLSTVVVNHIANTDVNATFTGLGTVDVGTSVTVGSDITPITATKTTTLNLNSSIFNTPTFNLKPDISGTIYNQCVLNLQSGTITVSGATAFTNLGFTGVTSSNTCSISNNSGSANSTLKISDGVTAVISNTTVTTNVTFTGASSTVEYSKAGSQTLPTTASSLTVSGYQNLIFSGAGTKTAAGAISVAGTLTYGSGSTFDMSTYALTGAFTPSGVGTLKTSNIANPPIPTGKTWTGTVQYGVLAGGQSISGGTYNNLTSSNTSNTNTVVTSDVTINGTFTTTASGTVDMSTFRLIDGGSGTFTNNGTIKTASTNALPIPASKAWAGTVEFTSASSQTVPSSTSFTNLTISGGGEKTISNSFTASGVLTLTSGLLTTGNYTISLSNTATGAVTGQTSSSYVNGILNRAMTTSTYIFPVGAGGSYYPFTLTAVTGTSPTATVKAFNSSASGTYASGTVSTTEYWQVDWGGTSVTAATVKLDRPGVISNMSLVGTSSSAPPSQAFTSLGGTISGTSITASTSVGTVSASTKYYAMLAAQSVIQINGASSDASVTGLNRCLTQSTQTDGSFTVSGSNIASSIVLTAPTNYEISSDNSTFSSSVTLSTTNGTIASTTIYVRLKSSLIAGSYNSETISITSSNATNRTVTLSGTVYSGITYVSTTGTDNVANGSTSGTGAYRTLTYAIAQVPSCGCQINVGSGTWGTGITDDDITLSTSNVSIIGAGKTLTIFDGAVMSDGAGERFMTISGSASNITISDMTIQNMGSTGFASNGAGMNVTTSGTVTLQDLHFKNCDLVTSSTSGGGLYMSGSGTTTVDRCTFSLNDEFSTSSSGASIYVVNGTRTIQNCLFYDNATYENYSGNVFLDAGTNKVYNCTFTENTGSGGSYTGEIYCNGGTNTLTNNIIWNNSSIYSVRTGGGTNTLTYLMYDDDPETSASSSFNDQDPLFLDAPNNDFSITAVSPARDAGTNTSMPTVDISEITRGSGGTNTGSAYDIGCYENTCLAGTYYVNDAVVESSSWTSAVGNNSTGTGSTTQPYLTLSKALNNCGCPGSTIKVDKGTYTDDDLTLSTVASSSSLIIQGYSKTTVIFDGSSASNGFGERFMAITTNATNVTLSDMTIQNMGGTGFTSNGAGINVTTSGTVTLQDIHFKNCDLVASSTGGGGLHMTGGGTTTVDRCTFSLNNEHTASSSGASIYVVNGTRTIQNCLFYDNATYENYSGNVFLDAGTNKVYNCTFTENTGSGASYTGEIYCNGGTNTLTNNIIWNNTSIYSVRTNGGANTLTYLLYDDDPETAATNSYNDQDPLFLDATNDDFSITAVSPARDAGTNTSMPTVDITEKIRGTGGTNTGSAYDIGCYENTCNSSGGPYYVNDASTSGDVYTSAVGNNSNAGTSGAPFLTLKKAIDQCGCGGTTIYVDAGTYTDDDLIVSTVATVGSPMIIQGASKTLTIFDGDAASNGAGERFMSITTNASYVTVSDMTIQDMGGAGFTSNGAGINVTTSGTVTLQDLHFKNCDLVTINTSGGGLYMSGSGTSTVDRCTFSLNNEFSTSSSGASIYVVNGTRTIQNCLFYDNATYENYSGNVFLDAGTNKVYNCTFTENTGSGASYTGEIYCNGGTNTLTNNIIWNNTSIYSVRTGGGTNSLTYLLYDDDPETAATNSYNDQDPLFLDATNDDFSITAVSPARDAGTNTSMPTVDITEKIRGSGGTNTGSAYDIGCYENTCNSTGGPYYVNDASTSGDVYTSAIGNNSNAGTSAAPFLTLKKAIDQCGCGGTTIYVDAGTYTDDDLVVSTVATVGSPMTIQGASKTLTIFDGDAASNGLGERFMAITTNASYVTVSDMTIQDMGGTGFTSNGAGINVTTSGTVTLQDIHFKNCDLVASSTGGGGIHMTGGGTTTVDRCTFSLNNEHTASSSGASIYVVNGTRTIQNCLFYDNATYENYSGNVFLDAGTNRVYNCTFTENTGSGASYTGEIYCNGGTNTLTNNIIWNNTSIYSVRTDAGANTLTYLLYDDDPETAATNSYNDQDPLFLNAANDDFSITAVSPARDAGTNTSMPTVDITEKIRGTGGTNTGSAYDIGCYENTCNSSGGPYYVNDASTSGDVYTSAVGNNSNAGTSAAPFLTLKKAIDQCGCGGTTIYVDAGTYTDDDLVVSTVATVGSPMTIQGASKTLTIFDGDAASNGLGERFMAITTNASYVTVSDMTIQDMGGTGFGTNNGAGINVTTSGTVTLQDIHFKNCDLVASSTGGGGLHMTGGGTTTVDRCTFSLNNEHSATSSGASIYVVNGTRTIQNCLFYDNATYENYSGNVFLDAGTNRVYNCTFTENTGSGASYTGEIYCNGGTNTLTNNIIWNNTSIYSVRTGGGTNTLSYLLYDDDPETAATNSFNDQNPLFTSASTDDFSLTSSSPAVDAGTATNAPNVDINGNARPTSNGYEIGCYEYQCGTSFAGTYTVGTGGTWTTLTAALLDLRLCMSGSVILELNDTYRTTNEASETYPLDFSSLPTSSTKTLTIRPKSTVSSVITLNGSSATTILNFNGTSYVTIDGRLGGAGSTSYLTIDNTSAAGASLRALLAYNNSTNNTIKYTTLKANNNSTTASTAGVVYFGDGSSGNNSNTIDNCTLTFSSSSVKCLIVNNNTTGTTSPLSITNCSLYDYGHRAIWNETGGSGFTVSTNSFYLTTSFDPGAVTSSSIYMNVGSGYTISSNIIGGANATAGSTAYTISSASAVRFVPIYVYQTSANTTSIQGNTIKNISITTSDGSTTTFGTFTGIYVDNATNASATGTLNIGTSSANMIGDTTASTSNDITVISSTSGGVSQGIALLSDGTTSVQNNLIGDFNTSNVSTKGYTFYGIDAGGSGTMTISSNKIGSLASANSIVIGGGLTGTGVCKFYGIYNNGTGAMTLNSNSIGNVGVWGTSTSNVIYGIYNNANTAATSYIQSNTLKALDMDGASTSSDIFVIANTSVNSITISSNTMTNFTETAGDFWGIYNNCNATGTHTITSNSLSSVSLAYSTGTFNGIELVGTGTYTCSSNSIQSISSSVTGTYYGLAFTAASTVTANSNVVQTITTNVAASNIIIGIYCASTGTYNLADNTLADFTNTNSGTGAPTICGIKFNAANASSTVQKNKMTGYAANLSSGPKLYGIWNNSTGTTLLYNNLFGCSNGSYTNECFIVGILDGTSISVGTAAISTLYYNTISITGSTASGTANATTACFAHYEATASKIQAIKNNIFNNQRTVTAGSSRHYCYWVGSASNIVATAGAIDYNYYSAPYNTYFAYPGTTTTATTFNASTRGYGGTNSKYYTSTSGNSNAITVGSDGSLTSTHATTVGAGADLDAISGCDVDIIGTTRNTSGGTKGCYEYVVCANPTITANPSTSTQTACPVVSLTALSITASGTTPTYQWYSNTTNSNSGGTAISGATSASYTPLSLTTGTKYYYCVATACSTTATSNASGAITVSAPMSTSPVSGDIIWVGSSTAWSTLGNWLTYNGSSYSTALAVPTSSDRVIISAANSCASAQPTLAANASVGDFIIESGASLNQSSYTLTVNGNFTIDGTFTASTGTTNFTGNSSSINGATAAPSFYNLVVNKTAGQTLSTGGSVTSITCTNNFIETTGNFTSPSTMNVNGTLTVTAGTFAVGSGTVTTTGATNNTGTITISTGTYDANGSFDATSGNVTFSGAGNLNLGSTVTSLGTFTRGSASGSTVTYDASGAQNVAAVDYYNLTFSGSGIKTLQGNIDISGSNGEGLLTVGSGTTFAIGDNTVTHTNLDDLGTENNTISGTVTLNNGTWTPTYGQSANLTTSGSITVTGTGIINLKGGRGHTLGTFTPGSGTVYYNRNGTMSIQANTFNNLIIAGTSDLKTLAGNITVNGDFTNSSTGSSFSASTYTLTAKGAFINNASFSAGTGTVVLNGTSAQTISGTTNPNFYNLTLNNSAGASIVLNTSVQNAFTFTTGKFTIPGSYTLTLGTSSANGSVTGYGTNSYFVAYDGGTIGYLKRFVNTKTATPYVCPIGDATNYTPLTMTVNSSSTLAAGAYFTVYTKAAKLTALGGSITKYVNRYWDVTPSGITTPNYDITYTYVTGDLVGGAPSALVPVKNSSGTMYSPSGSSFTTGTKEGTGYWDSGNKSLTWTGLSTFSLYSGAENGGVALPVTLYTFEAKPYNKDVMVTWKTASEYNNDYFTIERSDDGVNFKKLGDVKGAGNSTHTISYFLLDNEYSKGINYYRLKQTDFNGDFTYSKIVAIDMTVNIPKVIMTVNSIGQEVQQGYTGVVFDVYSDGTSVKRIQ